MSKQTLCQYLSEYFNWRLDTWSEARRQIDEADLAYKLERDGYSSNPYTEYDRALTCPINKRREKYCGCTHCTSHEFCMMLRKEGYV